MEHYTYQNTLISKKQLKNLLAWCFTKYGAVQASLLADELKYLGFKYATQAGISISIEDLRVPPAKLSILTEAENEISNAEELALRGKTTEVERFQKVISTWTLTSETLKDEVVSYFKTYDPLNSVYMMAFSGARGNISQVHQLVGMRGLMSDPSGEIIDLPIVKNFREGLRITDYLMSGYGARKGIVDTALKTANSGYLTRRLIDVAHDIIIREKDCNTEYSILFINKKNNKKITASFYDRILGRLLSKNVYDPITNDLIAKVNDQITPNLINLFQQKNIQVIFFRSPLTCNLNRSVCQKCYGWNLANENLVDLGEAVGIIAGQSIGEPGTQLTMRTFHTGGIFTAGGNKPIISPGDGVVKFSEVLKTSILRTSNGENVLITENSGQIFIIPENDEKDTVSIYLPSNSTLFITENQYIKQNAVIGQFVENTKQTKTETKNIVSDFSGEIKIINREQSKSTTTDKLIWLLAGQVYNIPTNSFLNFYDDYIINKNNYLFRIKLINRYAGFVKISNNKIDLSQQVIEVRNSFRDFPNSQIQKLTSPILENNYLLSFKNGKYLVNLGSNSQNSFNNTTANLLNQCFLTKTGGIPYQNFNHSNDYIKKTNRKTDFYYTNTIVWLAEETFILNRDSTLLLVENNEFIVENYEIVPNIFSKSMGIVKIVAKNNIIQEVIIKPGHLFLFELDNVKDEFKYHKKIFYSGESIELSHQTILINEPVFCEILDTSQGPQLEIRPLQLFEVPLPKSLKKTFESRLKKDSTFKIIPTLAQAFNWNEKIKAFDTQKIISETLQFQFSSQEVTKNRIENSLIANRQKKNNLQFISSEKFYINHYVPISLKYTNMNLCLLVENEQFINAYTAFGYLEICTQKYKKLVQLKSKKAINKQLLVISEDDCIVVPKDNETPNFVSNLTSENKSSLKIGKYLTETDHSILLQKGRPYFFPNCQTVKPKDPVKKEKKRKKTELETLPPVPILFKRNQLIIRYRDTSTRPKKLGSALLNNLDYQIYYKEKNYGSVSLVLDKKEKEFEITKNRILGLSLINKFNSINTDAGDLSTASLKTNDYSLNQLYLHKNEYRGEPTGKNVVLKKSSKRVQSTHTINIEQNTIYCKNGTFIEEGQPLGLLNFEKEVTGDIVQGLPRIEQLLEARKIEAKEKKLLYDFQSSPRERLIFLNSRLDSTFEFKKMMTTFKNSSNLNPHFLLNLYFEQYTTAKKNRLLNDKIGFVSRFDLYEGTYRSFKKVQDLILSSVQSVYRSQGVTISDKHLEIILKQMTAKVKIFKEGDTPLLPLEIIDLYQINYMNKIIFQSKKKTIGTKPALYRPILFGITKTALNSPSFISAASFQDTTRVLTRAAIEGRVDWLRGLKENVVIGHLIPAGTGYTKYSQSFKI